MVTIFTLEKEVSD